MDDYLEDIVSAKFETLDYINSFDDDSDFDSSASWMKRWMTNSLPFSMSSSRALRL